MKAARAHEPIGLEGIDGLVYEDAPDPAPAVGDVLVKVYAAGFTPTELQWPLWTDRAGHDRAPIIPAHEFSGVVAALGYGTAGAAVGDEVYGLVDGYRDGAAAELIAIEARDVAPKPATVDHVHAAAIPQAGLTSWQALFDHGQLAAGQTAVIHGAGGAVGSVAVQLARSAGAHVIGTGRASARSLALELGADSFVDLEQDRWEDAAGQADVVFDAIGGDVLARSRRSSSRAARSSRSAPLRPATATTSGRSTSSVSPAAPSSWSSPAWSTPANSGPRSVRCTRSPTPGRPSWPSRHGASRAR
jgi:NADPH:quinone reductase-like Zn-dependent oxidoreductase